MKRFLLSTAAALALASAAHAQGDALIIGNSDYSVLDRLTGADGVSAARPALEQEGFAVTALDQADPAGLRAAFSEFVDGLDDETGRVAVILSGRFAHSRTDSFLLPVDMDAPPDDVSVLRDGLALSQVLAVLASYPGEALLVLGEGDPEGFEARFVTAGSGALELPQGVSLLRGPAKEVARFARDSLVARGTSVLEAATRSGLEVDGYAPRGYVFVPNSAAVPAAVPEPDAADAAVREAAQTGPGDEATWDAARRRDDPEGYRSYLAAFPEGEHAGDARARISAIESEPFRDARLGEEAMSLDRDARREIQRDLSLLDFNTRGIDGIFGPGTREAVRNWQNENGFSSSGYLDREQIARLDGQAERRAGELEAEAQRRQAERESLDRAYWDETGARGDAPGLRAYLKRYPDGVFAELAQERLDVFQEQERAQAAARDREAWDQARATGTIAGYSSYLDAFPQGAFADRAQAEIEARRAPSASSQAQSRAEAGEAALNLNRAARQLAENRLQALGLKPGKVDGRFDDKTRRALRRYQDARDLTVSGYLDQATVVRLLADSLLR